MVTIKVPKKRLKPIFRFGFFISPAINVTLFHASLLKIDPTMEAATAPSMAIGKYSFIVPSDEMPFRSQAFVQFVLQVPAFDPSKKPKTIRPNNERSLIAVKVVWISFPLLIPLVLIHVRKIMRPIETN